MVSSATQAEGPARPGRGCAYRPMPHTASLRSWSSRASSTSTRVPESDRSLRRTLGPLYHQEHLVIDLAKTTFIDSSFVAFLVRLSAAQRAKRRDCCWFGRGGRCARCSPSSAWRTWCPCSRASRPPWDEPPPSGHLPGDPAGLSRRRAPQSARRRGTAGRRGRGTGGGWQLRGALSRSLLSSRAAPKMASSLMRRDFHDAGLEGLHAAGVAAVLLGKESSRTRGRTVTNEQLPHGVSSRWVGLASGPVVVVPATRPRAARTHSTGCTRRAAYRTRPPYRLAPHRMSWSSAWRRPRRGACCPEALSCCGTPSHSPPATAPWPPAPPPASSASPRSYADAALSASPRLGKIQEEMR